VQEEIDVASLPARLSILVLLVIRCFFQKKNTYTVHPMILVLFDLMDNGDRRLLAPELIKGLG